MNKYYFFRDLDNNGNLTSGKSYHSAGLVEEIINEEQNKTGNKDIVVSYLNPFEIVVTTTWRTYSEVELFEVSSDEYYFLKIKLKEFRNI